MRVNNSRLGKNRSGKDSFSWKGGRRKGGEKYGYIRIHCPTHPYCSKEGYVLEHRLVMEKHLGRILLPTERMHHINGIKDDNRIENLMLFSSNGDHISYEFKHCGLADKRPKPKRDSRGRFT